LGIKYDKLPPTSTKPMIQIAGKWRTLYNCHWIGELYDYWKDCLLVQNIEKLQTLAPNGQWLEDSEITAAIAIIAKYDKQSSFFRYPVTENKDLDLKKFTMQEVDVESLTTVLTKKKSGIEEEKDDLGKVILAIEDEKGEISTAYTKNENILEEVSEALKKVAHYFFCIHIMTRCTLCGGF
jgi:hypothetical protein